ncbi:hypothetical protein [Nocardia alni]|uniref:hypothetical protein n=1 Tax=Nocardia alni TaxID=2815723 RepID=UPI001C222ADF|nr:hypothetical protein [Nocardia alni]
MGTWSVGSVVLITLAGCGFALVGLSLLWSARPRRATIAGHRTPLARREAKTWSWPPGWSCSKPDRALTVAEAHLTMQMHREHSCARKRAAFETLITAGRITPDSSRLY